MINIALTGKTPFSKRLLFEEDCSGGWSRQDETRESGNCAPANERACRANFEHVMTDRSIASVAAERDRELSMQL